VYLRHCTDVWLEITMLLISGHNDADLEIDAECAWIDRHLGMTCHYTSQRDHFYTITPVAARSAPMREHRRFPSSILIHVRRAVGILLTR
jgi:pyruvate formate lyase activating enzyme